MSYFFYEGLLEIGQVSWLSGNEGRHAVQVRRLRPGETLVVQDQQGRRFRGVALEQTRSGLQFRTEELLPAIPASPLALHLVQALPKEKALDWVIQKATELGAQRLIIVPSQHSPQRWNSHNREHWRARWEKIAEEACKQSERQNAPELVLCEEMTQALVEVQACEVRWWLAPTGQNAMQWLTAQDNAPKPNSCALAIGPEGGWSLAELAQAQAQGWQLLRFGPRILRTETAALAIASIAQWLWGDLGQ